MWHFPRENWGAHVRIISVGLYTRLGMVVLTVVLVLMLRVSPTLGAGAIWRLSVSLPSDLPFLSLCFVLSGSWLTSTIRPIWGITSLTRHSLVPPGGRNSKLMFLFLIFKDNGKLPTRELPDSSCQFHVIKHEMVRMLILSVGRYTSQ